MTDCGLEDFPQYLPLPEKLRMCNITYWTVSCTLCQSLYNDIPFLLWSSLPLKKKRNKCSCPGYMSPMIQYYRQKGHTTWWKWDSSAKSILIVQPGTATNGKYRLTSNVCAFLVCFHYLQSSRSYWGQLSKNILQVSHPKVKSLHESLHWLLLPLVRRSILFLFISYVLSSLDPVWLITFSAAILLLYFPLTVSASSFLFEPPLSLGPWA